MEKKKKKESNVFLSDNNISSGWKKLQEDMKNKKFEGQSIGKSGKPQFSGGLKPIKMNDHWGIKKQKPLYTGPSLMMKQEQKEEPEEETEDLYWSAEDWEDWAFKLYEDVPDARKYLPSWFNEEMQKEDSEDEE